VTLYTGTQAQVTFGPDKYPIPIGKSGLLSAYISTPATGLVFASSDPVAAEVVAIAFLTFLYSRAPWFPKFKYGISRWMNGRVEGLGAHSVWDDPFVSHGLEIGLGEREVNPCYSGVPGVLQKQLDNLVQGAV